MKNEIADSLVHLRNELAAHTTRPPSPVDIARRIKAIDPEMPAAKVASLLATVFRWPASGIHLIPRDLIRIITELVSDSPAKVVCDPWAGLGAVISVLKDVTRAPEAIAITCNESEAAIGRVITHDVRWEVGSTLHLLESMGPIDVAASILPFGVRYSESIKVATTSGGFMEIRDDLGHLILTMTALRLTTAGIAIFVVPNSFLWSARTVRQHFDELGLGLEAVLALPAGAFAPYANLQTSIVVVRRKSLDRIFVAQLSADANTNSEILGNLKAEKDTGTIELGRFVEARAFKGLDSIRLTDRLDEVRRSYGFVAHSLSELTSNIKLGRFGAEPTFPRQENAIFIPLIGITDVVTSQDEFSLKPQNYAQVVVEPSRSVARFVAQFLNSDLGRDIREMSKAGATIPKLNTRALNELPIFVPDLSTQQAILEIEVRIASEENALLGLQNELAAFRRELWANPRNTIELNQRLQSFSNRLPNAARQHAVDRLDQWFETLPFPLASILRAWQATPSEDFKTRHEHLLHFFEATAEFLSVILLSAFSARDSVFEAHKLRLAEAMTKGNLSFQRATFGTWKLVVEYLAKQTRQLLSGDKDERAICADIFADPSSALPRMLARKELAAVLSTTNTMRNDWTGHGGVVSQGEAKLRNQQLVAELQKLQEAMGDVWSGTELVHALNCRPRRGVFENEVAILMGSNSEFLKESRQMSSWLDVERLYVARKDTGRALQLLPLITIGTSPASAKNACYFFNRLEGDGVRFISYHFSDCPELTGQFDDASETIKSLAGI
jgi:hypothetical protein